MKLRYYKKDDKKIYTMKKEVDDKKTEDAHYKFVKIKYTFKRKAIF